MLPTPTVSDATRHTTRAVWRPGENWRGVSLVNAVEDAGEIALLSTPNTMDMLPARGADALEYVLHRGDMGSARRASTGNLREDVMTVRTDANPVLPTPTSNEWNGGTIEPGRRAAMGHAVTVADWAEKSGDISVLPTPGALMAEHGGPVPPAVRREGGYMVNLNDETDRGGDISVLPTPTAFDESAERRASRLHMPGSLHSTNLSWTSGEIMDGVFAPTAPAPAADAGVLPTPTSRDAKGRNQRNTPDCLPVAADRTPLGAVAPADGPSWGLDDGRGVAWGRFDTAIHRWERVLGRPTPCPTQATAALRRWVDAHRSDPTLFAPAWLARHAVWDATPRARLDRPMRDRVLARWRTAGGMGVIDPAFWPGPAGLDPDLPIPATRLPARCVLDYWAARERMARGRDARFPTPAHLSPRFVEWMMGLDDGWVTDPAIWRRVDGNHRNLQLRALGNGVVPAQAAAAVDWCLTVRERLAGDAEGE